MLAELVDEVYGLQGIAFLGVMGVADANVDAVHVLADIVAVDLEEADTGVVHVVDDAVEDTVPDLRRLEAVVIPAFDMVFLGFLVFVF